MDDKASEAGVVALVAEVVSAYVANNALPVPELPGLIRDVHAAFMDVASPAPSEPAPEPRRASASEIRRSIAPEHLVSFEDGKPYKALRRHLTTRGLTPEAYRAKWGLPADYPMVSPNYAKQRSEMALALGLGRKREEGASQVSPDDPPQTEAADAAVVEAAPAAEDAPSEVTPAPKPKRVSAPRARKAKAVPAAT